MELISDVTPSELLLSGGHNPFRLLHSALSVGIHGLSDASCLTRAHSVRIVLTALLDKLQSVTEEKAELDAAISELLKPPAESEPDPPEE